MHSETATSIDPAKVAERFLRPTRRSSNGKNKLAGERFWVNGPVGRIAVTRMVQGPPVMLVHGWEGRPADLAAFVPLLVAGGYEVIAHSIGCPMTVEAADQGMDVARLVWIEAHARYVDYATTFAARAGLDREPAHTAGVVHPFDRRPGGIHRRWTGRSVGVEHSKDPGVLDVAVEFIAHGYNKSE
jgi:hypothetical protein